MDEWQRDLRFQSLRRSVNGVAGYQKEIGPGALEGGPQPHQLVTKQIPSTLPLVSFHELKIRLRQHKFGAVKAPQSPGDCLVDFLVIHGRAWPRYTADHAYGFHMDTLMKDKPDPGGDPDRVGFVSRTCAILSPRCLPG